MLCSIFDRQEVFHTSYLGGVLHSRVFWAAVFLADFIRGFTPPVAGGQALRSELLNTRII
jgi:hypothetical protein